MLQTTQQELRDHNTAKLFEPTINDLFEECFARIEAQSEAFLSLQATALSNLLIQNEAWHELLNQAKADGNNPKKS